MVEFFSAVDRRSLSVGDRRRRAYLLFKVVLFPVFDGNRK